ncbi:Uncharacterised protein [Iodobacter fluviatilis]|uniref:Uncharacterized protein n=1 Tax=Iodobacter fluviatilis TaxID=537 RepID=A0A377SXN3_9NEIS|nr:Uncharacterised protein [Iodobacter fluviatilis]
MLENRRANGSFFAGKTAKLIKTPAPGLNLADLVCDAAFFYDMEQRSCSRCESCRPKCGAMFYIDGLRGHPVY